MSGNIPLVGGGDGAPRPILALLEGGGAPRPVFTAFDLETTGLYPGVDRIVEIGAVSFGPEGVGTFETFVDPGIPVPAEARRVNCITDEMLLGAPPIEEALPRFLSFLAGSFPIAHNASFDVGFISREMARLGIDSPDVPVIDTRGLARCVFPNRHSYSLSSLRREHCLEGREIHRALADALTCRDLFLVCVRRLAAQGVCRVEDILERSGPPLSFVSRRPPEAERICLLSRALGKGEPVEITYMSGRGERTVRRITPLSFLLVGGVPALEAFCHLREERRTFLISSMERIEPVAGC